MNALDDLKLWEDSWFLMIEGPLRSDSLLDVVFPMETPGLQRAAAYIDDGTATIEQLTDEISDIVDALSVPNFINLAVPRGRRRVLVNLQPDPLLLLALALPIHNFQQLSLRSQAWSPDLRDRWRSCAIAAAFSGFN